jgi:hypothetical protein
MPRSGDQFPQERGGSDIRWPTRNLLDYTQPLNDTAVEAGSRITNQIAAASQQGGQQASNTTITNLLQQLGIGSVIGDNATAQLGDYLAQLLTPNSALNASNLWGLLPPGTLGGVPSTSITDAPNNPLWNPNFEGAVSLGAADGWSWDNITYCPPPGPAPFYPVGSAKVTADGHTHVLKSNPFAVSANQTVAFTVPVLGTNLVSTGNPIKMSVVQYLDDTIVGTQDIQALPAPVGPTTGWVAPPAGSHGTLLTGSYITPIDHTVNKIRLLLTLTSTATAGVARYGAVGVTISGGVISTLQDGIDSLNRDSAAATAAAATFQTAVLTAITVHAGDWGAMYAAISAAYTVYATTTADLAADEVATLGQLLSSMLGINPETGTIASGKVDGLTALQSGFNDLQTESETQQEAWRDMVASWETTLANGSLSWATKLAQMNAAFSTYQQVAQQMTAASVITIDTIINGLLGVDPTTGIIASNKVAGLPALQTGFADLQSESNDQQAAWRTMISSWETTLANGALSWTTKIAQMETAFSTYQQAAQGVASAQVITLTSIVNGLIGINPTTGLTPKVQIEGLNTSLSQLAAATAGDTNNSGDWTWLADIVSEFFNTASTAQDTSVANSNTLGIRTNKPLIYGLDDTTESNIAFTDATAQINVTSAATRWTFVRCGQDDVKNTVAFTANTTAAPTGFYAWVYKVNYTTNTMRYITTSANLVALLSAAEAWIFVDASGTDVDPGDVIAIEFQVVGTGSVNVYGKVGSSTKPIHPNANLQGVSATRTTVPGMAWTTPISGLGTGGPTGIALDAAGAIYLADRGNNRALKYVGATQTVLGFTGLSLPQGIAVDAAGAVYVVDAGNNRVVKLLAGAQTTLPFTGLHSPSGIALGPDGAVYVSDNTTGNHRVLKLLGGVQTTLAFTGVAAVTLGAVALDSTGAVYVIDGTNARVLKLSGATQTVLAFTGLIGPTGVAVVGSTVYVTDRSNSVIKVLSGTTQTSIAVQAFGGTNAAPDGLVIGPDGTYYVSDDTRRGVAQGSANTAFSALTFAQGSIPYVGLETSSPPPPVYPDKQKAFVTPGVMTQKLETWVTTVDLVSLGQGGGGQGETGGTVGRGGSPGQWATRTLVVGTDIVAGGTLTITIQADPSSSGVNAPASGGAYFADGHAGAATVISWVDPGGTARSLSGAGGAGGGLANGSNLTTYGQSPGNITFNGYAYTGGGAALVPEDGLAPGGSGPGGQPFQYGFNGARGQAWTVQHQ